TEPAAETGPQRPAPLPRRTFHPPLHDPDRNERGEEQSRLASENRDGEERTREGPPERRRVVIAAHESPEEEQRARDGDDVAQKERFVEEKRPIQRRSQRRDRGRWGVEEVASEEEDEPDVQRAEQRLDEADAEEAIAGEPANAREGVRIQRGLLEDGVATPPSLPCALRGDVAHPPRGRVDAVPAEHVSTQDPPGPDEVRGHVRLGPVELIRCDRQPGCVP